MTLGGDIILSLKKILNIVFIFFIISSITLSPALASISSKKKESKRVKHQLDSLKKGLEETTQEYELAYQKYSQISYQIDKTQDRLQVTRSELAKNQKKLNKRVSDIYLHGSISLFEVLFGCQDFIEFLNRLDYLKRIGEKDKEILNENKKLKKELEREENKLVNQQEDQIKIVNKLNEKQEKIEASLSKQKKILSGIEEEIKKLEEEERRRRMYALSSRSKSKSSYAQISGVVTNIVDNGFIFPVAGPNSFIDSFGYPRPGHSHQGTDIMAPKGTPVVASINGVFKAKKGSRHTYGGGWRGMLYASNGTYYYYAHLDDFAPGILASSSSYSSGVSVKAGQVIGYVGNSGNAGPYHLHFEIHPGGGGAINPYPILKAAQ